MKNIIKAICTGIILLIGSVGFAQEKSADMTISFEKAEDKNICKVEVVSEGKPAAEVAVKLYVKRLFGNLPIGEEVATDESGVAVFEFPNDIPLNEEGNLIVLAKVEDDENYGSFDAETTTKIGTPKKVTEINVNERSIAGSDAPIYFIVASLVVFAGIWAAILYVVLLVFKIKKSAIQLNQ